MKLTTAFLPLAASVVAIQHDGDTAQIPLEPSTTLESKPLTLDAIPLLGYGTWNLKGDNVSGAVSWAIQTGYRHIDCAAAYGNEDLVGAGIADGLAKAGLTREDLWVTSKLWNDHPSHGTTAPEAGIDTTLARLGVGYLDLYHMHWPVAQTSGANKIEYHATWAAMGLLLAQGKTRHIGVSNFDPEQLEDLLNHTSHVPSVHQMELHPYLPQTEWIAFHKKHGIHVTAYSPFAGTNPTYTWGDLEPLIQNPVLKAIADKRSCTPAQVALAWGMGRGTSVIPKSQHKAYIEENFGSLGCVLKRGDVEEIDALGKAHHRFNNPSEGWKVPLYKGLEGT
ncbi:hypothetical protein LTR53_006209 [Teratosphaeriaceae sp. CCFEE 6253]|nr:hypothetical protein LTR53_006209 [Teratosphaeriaceae sp. CCFEE 6253]